MNDKKQRYNTIQKPYNNKYHNNNEKPRLITSYMDEQHNISLYAQPPKGIAPMKGVVFTSAKFSYLRYILGCVVLYDKKELLAHPTQTHKSTL